MGYREVRIVNIKEVIRRWRSGEGARRVAGGTGLSRTTVRRYLREACRLGITREGPEPTEEQLAELVEKFRPGRRASESEASTRLQPWQKRIQHWLEKDEMQLTRVHELLADHQVDVSYASLRRVAMGWGLVSRTKVTVRREPCEPGELAEVDFGRMGLLWDEVSQRRRRAHAFVMTLGYSRHQFLALTFDQSLDTVIQLFEQGLRFFEGVPRRLVWDYVPRNIIDLLCPTALCAGGPRHGASGQGGGPPSCPQGT